MTCKKKSNEVNVTNPSHHKRVTLCTQVPRYYGTLLFGEPQRVQSGPIEDGFGVPRGTRSMHKPPLSVLIVAHCGVPTIGFPFGKLMIPCFEATKDADEPFGDQKMLIETLRPRLNNSDRLKSRDV